jgi:hypothetical protein
MADIISLPSATYRATTLDELWAEAETLGEVSVQNWFGRYRATISFKTRSGSAVQSHGEHRSASIALGLAINEARNMGAGEPG